MRKSYIIASIAFCALFLTSCGKKDYASVIPADATFVASINLDEMATQADLKNSSVINFMKGYVGLVASGDEKELVNAAIDDPSLMGIDFTAPAYVFETIDHSWGLVLKVDDSDHLDETFKILAKQQIATTPKEKEGLMWTSLLGDVNVAYDSRQLLILMPQPAQSTPARIKKQMTTLFTQDEDLTFAATDKMQRLEEQDAPIAVYTRMAALPADMAQTFSTMLPQGVRSADVDVSLSVEFKNGEAVLRSKMYSDNERVLKLFDEADEHMHKIQGEFMGAASEGFFAWMSVGCEGEWLLNLLKQNEQAKQALFMLERGIDIEKMLRSIDGDLTLVLPQEPSADGVAKTDFIALAQIDNSDFMSEVPSWSKTARDYGITLTPSGQNQYVMKAQDMEVQWGVDSKTMFFTTPSASLQKAFAKPDNALAAYKDEITDSQFFAYINLQGYSNLSQTPIKAIVIKSEETGEVELRLVGKDSERSILSQALDMLSGLSLF